MATGTVQTRDRVPGSRRNWKNRRGYKSVDVWHCLSLHSEQEALLDDFPPLHKKGGIDFPS